jgi:hypothetical protein
VPGLCLVKLLIKRAHSANILTLDHPTKKRGPMAQPGRPVDERRARWKARYGLQWTRCRLPIRLLDQLDQCRSEEARRIILGLNRTTDEPANSLDPDRLDLLY